MPVLSKVIKTKGITLPISGAKVRIATMLTLSDEEYISSITNEAEQSVRMATRAIRGWDFTAEDGTTVLEINEENVRMIPNIDGQYLLTQFLDAVRENREKAEASAAEAAKPQDVPVEPETTPVAA